MGSLQEYPVNVGVLQGSILGHALFMLYFNDLPDHVICDIGYCVNDTSLYSKCDQASDLWQQLELASEPEFDLWDTVNWDRKWLADFSAEKPQLVLFDQSNSTDAIDVKMHGSILQEKSSCKMLGLNFSLNWMIGSYIISVAKIASNWIPSMKFLSPKVVLHLYKSSIHPSMEYCCHVRAGAPSWYLELLDKLQKWICRTNSPSLATSIECLAHHWNV